MLALSLAFMATAAFAAEGALDTTFTGDGSWYDTSTSFPASDWDVSDATTSPDGRLVIAGRRDFNQDGNFGSLFWQALHDSGSAGRCVFDLPDDSATSATLGFDSAGRLLLAGTYDDASEGDRLVVARFLYPACTLDESFGGGAGFVYPIAIAQLVLRDLALDANDRMILVGYQNSGDATIVRLAADGALDDGFDGDGHRAEPFDALGASTVGFSGVVALPNGRIAAAGNGLLSSGGTQIVVARYGENGAPDTSFSGDGFFAASFSAVDPAVVDLVRGVAYDAARARLYVAGRTTVSGVERAALAAISWAGALDAGFSADGRATSSALSQFHALSVDGLGRVVAAGTSGDGAATDFAFGVERYLSSGSLDGAFSSDGRATCDFDTVAGGDDPGRAVALLPGSVAVAGTVERSSRIAVGVARFSQALLFADGFESAGSGAW